MLYNIALTWNVSVIGDVNKNRILCYFTNTNRQHELYESERYNFYKLHGYCSLKNWFVKN